MTSVTLTKGFTYVEETFLLFSSIADFFDMQQV